MAINTDGASDRLKRVMAIQRGEAPSAMEQSQRGGFGKQKDLFMSNEEMDQIINNEVPETSDPHRDYLSDLRRMLTSAYDAQQNQRDEAFKCLDYYHGLQLDSRIISEMRRRKQPPNYWNKIRPAIDGVLGLLDSSETDPEAVARNDNDDAAAGTVTEILRYLVDETDFKNIKREVSFDLLAMGIGIDTIEVDVETGDARVAQIPYDEFFYDPYSQKHDFRDARYLGRARFVDRPTAQRMFPEHKDWFWGINDTLFTGLGPEDNPSRAKIWLDERQRVLLCEIYFVDDDTGHWMHANFCYTGVMDYEVSPFLDDKGEPCCPIQAVTYQIDRNTDRYGMIRDMMPLQDSINSRISRMLHLTNSAQVEAVDDSALPADRNIARAEASRADGAMPKGWKRVPVVDIFQGNKLILDGDMQAIERMAPSPALLGRASGANESGRARQVLQQAGLTELERAFARYEHWELRNYKQMWFRTRQFMKEPRLIRITDNAGVKQSLAINVPIPMGPDGQPPIDPKTGQPAMVVSSLEIGLDINMKTVRESDSLRQETLDSVFQLVQKSGISMLDPSFELVLELVPLPDKEYILKKYRDLRDQVQQQQAEQAQQQAAQQQQMMEMQMESTRAKTVKTASEAQKNQSLASLHAVQAHNEAQQGDDAAKASDLEFKHQDLLLQNEKLSLQVRHLKAQLGLDPDQPFPGQE